MKFSHFVLTLLPIITFINGNVQSTNLPKNQELNQINEINNNEVNNNEKIANILGDGFKITIDNDDFAGEAIGYFCPKKNVSDLIQVKVLGDNDKKATLSVSDGKFYLLDEHDDDLSSNYAIVKYNNEYYLAIYDKNNKNLLVNDWILCDAEYEAMIANNIGTSYGKHIMVDMVEKIKTKTKSGDYNISKKSPYHVIQKALQIGTNYCSDNGKVSKKLEIGTLDRNRKDIQRIINDWKKSKDYKYVQEFINKYYIKNYFGTSKKNFEELLEDIDLYYIALDKYTQGKK